MSSDSSDLKCPKCGSYFCGNTEHREQSNKDPEFRVGDIVEAFGDRGYVRAVVGQQHYPIQVEFSHGYWEHFMPDGRMKPWHKTPSLKLIERPKKKKKVWVNLYRPSRDEHLNAYMYPSKYIADLEALSGRIACVEIEVADE